MTDTPQPVRAYLIDAVTGKTIGTLDYVLDRIAPELAELVSGLDTRRTYSIEMGGRMYTGVRVASKETSFQ